MFILLFAPFAFASAVVSLTGGATWMMAAAISSQLHRQNGYKPNEGHFTERCQNQYWGVWFDINSEYDLNRGLGELSAALPGIFPCSKKFDMTQSEGEFLRAMMAPALAGLADFRAAKELVADMHGTDESFELLYAEADKLASIAFPIARWLEQFPRTKDAL